MSDVPIGSIVAILEASSTSPPTGWLLCDGSPCPTNYPLASLLTDLPDLRGYTLIGADGSSYPAQYPAQTQHGATTASHTLTLQEMPAHNHYGFGEHNGDWPLGETGSQNNPGSHGGVDNDNYYYNTSVSGSSNAFTINIMQPSYAVYYFIYAGEET